MISRKIFVMLLPVAVLLLAIRCNDDEAITYSVTDVSSRVTGFSNPRTGPGAELTINGSQLQHVQRMFLGDQMIGKQDFISQTESAIAFTVPASATPNTPGEKTTLLVVFNGSERAYKEIEVVPFQAISSFTPYSAAEGETVTLMGVNFDLVTAVQVGSTSATIVSQTPTQLQFEMPAGATTGRILLTSEAGTSSSTTDLVACTASPTAADCAPGLNLNSGFELGTGDDLTNWGQWNGNAFMTETTNPANVYRGSRALRVTRDGTLASGEWRLQLASDPVTTEPGASYTVHIWAKATVAGGSMRVSTNPNALYTANQNVPTAWTRLAFTFTANEPSTRVVLDLNGNNTVATTFYIDDVKLIKN